MHAGKFGNEATIYLVKGLIGLPNNNLNVTNSNPDSLPKLLNKCRKVSDYRRLLALGSNSLLKYKKYLSSTKTVASSEKAGLV